MGLLLKSIRLLERGSSQTYLVASFIATFILGVLFYVLRGGVGTHERAGLSIARVPASSYYALYRARQRFTSFGGEMLREAYFEPKHRNKPFIIPTNSNDRIVLTPSQIHELASAPEDLVSLEHAVDEIMHSKYTGLSRFNGLNYVKDVLRTKLTRKLGDLVGPMVEESRLAFASELPACDDWTSVQIYPKILQVVARTTARAFVGSPLCRDEEWLKVSTMFTIDVFTAVAVLRQVPWFLRPIIAYIANSKGNIDRHRKVAISRLSPVIGQRLAEEEAARAAGKPGKSHDDLIQWFSDVVKPKDRTVDALAELQLLTSMAAIHTTSLSLANVLLDLATHPEYIEPLREEMGAVIRDDGGTVQKTSLSKMRKVDSFIKETFRGKMSLFSFNRKVMKSFTLSDGTHLPKGATLSAPATMFDIDPDLLDNPQVFDGLRSYKKYLTMEAGKPDIYHTVTTSPSYLTFSHGKHACPGRYFATDEIKLLLCQLLLQYDLKYSEAQSRLKPIVWSESIGVDPAQVLMFREIPGPKEFDFL